MFRSIINWFIKHFIRNPLSATTSRVDSQQANDDFHDLPPGYIPKETCLQNFQVPGTDLYAGIRARVVQAPTGELLTCEQQTGIDLGCGHKIFSIDEIRTENFIRLGLGGSCKNCQETAEDKYSKGLINKKQAQEQSHYCTMCESLCQGCGRRNICVSHTKLFDFGDGSQKLLCPDCYKKAESEKFFKDSVSFLLSPFLINDNSQNSRRQRSDYEY